ncbi:MULTISPECIES: Imm70 family immunity protein [unclassified Bacillus cereus group]|uniref:Imm70 family immunity protein n=1 Tax=unclassified Bacillus cereus group TaxID=2750818 RepID=UPI001F5A687C|nr:MULTISPECIES: Imm70 family immunity protein [unclassified Bacillus cereus group]
MSNVGFGIDFMFYEVGHPDFLHSFFSTMSYHTEPEGWGTKYPLLMKNLYFDKLNWEDVEEARKNLKEIQSILQKKKPEEIIWDIEDITKRPPWEGKALPSQVVDLVTYFAREDGKTFSDLLFKAFDFSETLKHEIVIRKSLADTTF